MKNWRRDWSWLTRAIDHQIRNGATVKSLAEFYCVSRQRMWKVLKDFDIDPPGRGRK